MSTPVEFPEGTQFDVRAALQDENGVKATVDLSFTVTHEIYDATGVTVPTQEQIADAISDLYQLKGWPALVFSGRPAAVAVNP
ncbi:hypothetical protein [Streptomyces sp. NPDC005407]|uniref:hypothetical protein n=1 Tax=Streptomyces sp. NPDC005407 TaxID=3155340 RepID=UPI0033A8FB76